MAADPTEHQRTTLRTRRTTVKRLPERGVYDRATIHAILDEALICHLGFVSDGQPFVIPTGFARDGDSLFVHGSPASRMLRTVSGGVPVCLTVTLVDGMVLARSAFHSSMNYRSVVVLGTATPVIDPDRRLHAMKALVDHLIPGRWDDLRPITQKELKATLILEIPLAEASAKVRTGGPKDDEEDYALPIWAGVVPLALTPSAPVADERLTDPVDAPAYARNYRRPRPDATD
jgi:nitroimidazol reductase NimA-like FMN-containing flavoprotein (pyridoxamine 5'-phosphate oxidase superfamily)